MTKYLIKLTPLDTFFFSRENKYRKKKDKNNKSTYEADYFQKSAYFPQQTTVFGMLRYYLLLINNQIPITDTDKAEELIGKKSFNISVANPGFGKIKKISEIFIIDENNNCFYKNPKDIVIVKGNLKTLNKTEAPFKSNFKDEDNTLFFENYNEKHGLDNFLFHSFDKYMATQYDTAYQEKINKGIKLIPNGIFIKKERVGITKNKKGGTQLKAFYKQIYYSLLNGYSFAFTADLDYDFNNKHSGYVSMGAEKNPFKITIQKFEDDTLNQVQIPDSNSPKIVLLSDAYLSNYDKNDFQFAISTTKTFRFLNTVVKKGNKYYSSDPLDKDKNKITRSDKFNLLEKGSVFYFKDEEQMNDFSKKLNKEKNLIQIGYNQHKKINQ